MPDGLEREGQPGPTPRLRRRRQDVHQLAHRDLVRRELQKNRPSARGGSFRCLRAATDPREHVHGAVVAAAGDEGSNFFPLCSARSEAEQASQSEAGFRA
jgi:hypothetical protein